MCGKWGGRVVYNFMEIYYILFSAVESRYGELI
jgi:hypothetical protein